MTCPSADTLTDAIHTRGRSSTLERAAEAICSVRTIDLAVAIIVDPIAAICLGDTLGVASGDGIRAGFGSMHVTAARRAGWHC